MDQQLSPMKMLMGGGALLALLLVLVLGGRLVEGLDANEIMVVQSPVKGTLTWYITPGVKWQGFGKVTKYHKRSQFWFSSKGDQGKDNDDSSKIRFNDGGHANLSGSIAWEMPVDEESLNKLHSKYGSHLAVEQQLVRTIVEKSVYMTGPLMSSKESSAERRNDLLRFIEDQIQKGVYRTETQQEKQPDPMTGTIKTVNLVKLLTDKNGLPLRQEASPLEEFHVRTFNLSINELKYDTTVEAQIQQQQQALMQVQTAVAKAREAEQAAITAAKNGEAEAAKAKWEQEVIKARAVTQAQQQLEVARLDAEAAAQTKRKEILLGEGEAERRKLVMSADGALDKKLSAYVEVNKFYADAIKGYQGNWVPNVMMGGSGSHGTTGSGATELIQLLNAKTAMDLGLNMNVSGTEKTKQKQ